MRYLIYGTGAVGSMLGAQLALSGEQVIFLARPRVQQYMAKGIILTGLPSPSRLANPTIHTTLEDAVTSEAIDVVLLTVKAYDVKSAGEKIRELLTNTTPVLCLSNGIGSEATLANIIGAQNVIAASLTTAVHLQPTGEVHIARERGLGVSGSHPSLPQIVSNFINAGIKTRSYAHAEPMKWSKLLINIISNASCAILGWTPDQIFNHPGLFRIELAALGEALKAMKRKGLRVENLPGVPVSLLQLAIPLRGKLVARALGHVVARGRGKKRPSLSYDIGQGRSEIKWLNGAIVEQGSQLGFPTPANTVLTEIMSKLVDKSSEHSRFLNQPNELLKLASAAGVSGIQGYNAIGPEQ